MKYINRKLKTILLSGLLSMGIVATNYIAFNKQVLLVVDGQEIEVKSTQPDVQGVLDENNIDYDSNDQISEDLDASLENGMTIQVKKMQKTELKETQKIDFETIIRKDNTLEKGETKIVQEGKKGTKELIYEVIYQDGYLASQNLIKENIIEEAVDKIVVEGTKEKEIVNTNSSKTGSNAIKTSASSSNSSQGRKMVVQATAYSGDGITSRGTVPKWGTIAVDPTVIPYGTRVYIPQFNSYFIAEDCGGGIKGNKIDIFMNSEAQCNSWGRRTIDIYIVG